MKRFSIPRMERINLVSQIITVASPCNSKYCAGFECEVCDDTACGNAFGGCLEVSPCNAHNCQCYLCPYYTGTSTGC